MICISVPASFSCSRCEEPPKTGEFSAFWMSSSLAFTPPRPCPPRCARICALYTYKLSGAVTCACASITIPIPPLKPAPAGAIHDIAELRRAELRRVKLREILSCRTRACWRCGLPFRSRRNVVEPHQVDSVAFAVLGHLEEIDHAEETGGASQPRGDIGEADRLDGIDLDLAFFHPVAAANGDARAFPEAHATGNFAIADSVAQPAGEGH